MSDNISLKYLFDQHNLNARQARWLSFISEYDFEIKHIKRKENKVEGTLILHANLPYATKRSRYETDSEDKIKNVEKFDKHYHSLKEKTSKNEVNRVKT